MKNYLFLSIVLSVLTCRANGATDKNINYTLNSATSILTHSHDTIKYLRDSIITRKEEFHHKELNVILRKLHLTVRSYSYHTSKPGGPIKYITLFFDDSNTTSSKLQNRIKIPFLVIDFENEITGGKPLGLYSKSFGAWLDGEKDFYGKMLVKDVAGVNNGKN
jgi:hypothetical protein